MSLLAVAAFKWLMMMHPHKTDTESLDERSARMQVLARSMESAVNAASCFGLPSPCKPILSDRRLGMALLLGKGHFESDFAEYVHSGHCELGPVGARCDADKNGDARAHGPWQQWRMSVYPVADWYEMVGVTEQATSLAAAHALELLAGSLHRCPDQYPGDNIAQAIAGFAGTCITMKPGKVARQADYVRKILNTLPAE